MMGLWSIVFNDKKNNKLKNASKNRLTRILQSIEETPFFGFASPEALKHELSGKWSRELSKKDREIYSVEDNIIKIYSLLGHYKNKQIQ